MKRTLELKKVGEVSVLTDKETGETLVENVGDIYKGETPALEFLTKSVKESLTKKIAIVSIEYEVSDNEDNF